MECKLYPIEHNHEPIRLRNYQSVVIGRSPETLITDKKCSRHQAELTADYDKKVVHFKQLGVNPAATAGHFIQRGETYTFGNGGTFGLVNNKYMYSVHFIEKTNDDDDVHNNMVERSKTLKVQSKRKIIEARANEKKSKIGNDNVQTKISSSPIKYDLNVLREEFGDELVNEMRQSQQDEKFCVESHDQCKIIENPTWIVNQSLLVFSSKGLSHKAKILSFDLDGTLIIPKSGKKFPIGADDWRLLQTNTNSKMRLFLEQNFKLVIFTNQKGLGTKNITIEGFKRRIEHIVQKIGVPIQCFVSLKDDINRKPCPGAWLQLQNTYNGGIEIDKSNSIYVGDAAGRPDKWSVGKKKDFSCSDRYFAANIGLKFLTPEEFFLGWKPAKFSWPTFDPRKLVKGTNSYLNILYPTEAEIIVVVGFPASGKTTFVNENLLPRGYHHVNRDTLGTWQKCVSECRAAISQKRCVVVDNTNPNRESRKRYIGVAKEIGVKVRCFHVKTSFEQSRHQNKFRELTNKYQTYKPVGFMAFNNYKSSYEEPTLSEGFDEILNIDIQPKFNTEEDETLWYSFLL